MGMFKEIFELVITAMCLTRRAFSGGVRALVRLRQEDLMQKATITFSDGANGELHLSMEFDPEITDDTRSNAVAYALKCMDYVTGALQGKEVKNVPE
jgi:hypothetical protein